MRYGYPPSKITIHLKKSDESVLIFSYNVDDHSLKAIENALTVINEQMNILMIYKVERAIFRNKIGHFKAELRIQV
jgi:hypothetical protein